MIRSGPLRIALAAAALLAGGRALATSAPPDAAPVRVRLVKTGPGSSDHWAAHSRFQPSFPVPPNGESQPDVPQPRAQVTSCSRHSK